MDKFLEIRPGVNYLEVFHTYPQGRVEIETVIHRLRAGIS